MAGSVTYRKVKESILNRIMAGDWPPGTLLPNEIDLAQEFSTTRSTVSRAMRELVEDGLVERKRKAGTRVRQTPLRQARLDIPLVRVDIEEQGAGYRYALVESSICRAPGWLRARLSLPAGAEVRHVLCMHFNDGQPYQLEDRWINLRSVPAARTADFSVEGPNEWLVRQMPYSSVEISFSATAADTDQALHMGCAVGDALFRIERQTSWQGQELTFVRLIYHRGYRLTTRY